MTSRSSAPQVDIVVVSHHNRDGTTGVQFGAVKGTSAGSDRTKTEEYQKQFAHVALDTGADLVFGHGTHTVQGVEMYKGKPILYAIGHSNFDQPGYEKSKDGLVARVVIQGKTSCGCRSSPSRAMATTTSRCSIRRTARARNVPTSRIDRAIHRFASTVKKWC